MAKTYGNIARDGGHAPMQVASSISTQDSTAVPQTSPLSYTSAVTTITIPVNAAEIVLNPTTQIRISELAAMTRYTVVPALSPMVVPCGKLDSLYVTRDATSGSLRFHFHLV